MSVDLVNAQMAEAWQVQRKRWKSVAAGGHERWTVVRSSGEPERVAHHE